MNRKSTSDYRMAEKRYRAAEKEFAIQNSRWEKTVRRSVDILDDAIDLLRSVDKIPAKYSSELAEVSNNRMRIVEKEISRENGFDLSCNVKTVINAGRKAAEIGIAAAGVCVAAIAGLNKERRADDGKELMKSIASVAEEETKIRNKISVLMKKNNDVEAAAISLKKMTKRYESIGGKKYGIFTKHKIARLIVQMKILANKMR